MQYLLNNTKNNSIVNLHIKNNEVNVQILIAVLQIILVIYCFYACESHTYIIILLHLLEKNCCILLV